jgi:hypothetical protein
LFCRTIPKTKKSGKSNNGQTQEGILDIPHKLSLYLITFIEDDMVTYYYALKLFSASSFAAKSDWWVRMINS